MIKKLIHDPMLLAGKSETATKDDLPTAKDLLDTLIFYREECVGMAANMIGVRKRIIAFVDESSKKTVYTIMLNPEIINQSGMYEAEEGCLSLLGEPRKCKRYKKITVQYFSIDMKSYKRTFEGWTAQIIQHEIDHCNGVLI